MPKVEIDMNVYPQRRLSVYHIREGDQVEIAGWPAMVKFSEPYSEYLWSLTVEGHFKDGDPFTTSVTLPGDVRLKIRRKPTRREHGDE